MKRFALGLLFSFGMIFAITSADSLAQDKKEEKKDDKKEDKKEAKKGKLLTTKQIMAKLNGSIKEIGAEIKGAEPKWDVLLMKSKVALTTVRDLPKNEPKKGDAESWKKLSEAYVVSFEKLEEAIDKKDSDATKAASKEIGNSCGACHTAHKEKAKGK